MENKVKCCGISEDMSTITQIFVSKNGKTTDITDEAQSILENLENVLLHNYDRKNIEGELGLWCCTKNSGVGYFGLVDPIYPDRLSYKMLKELGDFYADFQEKHDLSELKKNGKKLLEKYNNPSSFDKLTRANQGVNEIKVDMQENINQLVNGQEDLNELEGQTNNMRTQAMTFKKKTKTLEREMFWKKIKYTLYIVLMVIILIVIIVLIAKLI